VLVLTMSEDASVLAAALRAGAHGYLVKGAEPPDIERALRSVAAGQAIFGEEVAAALLSQASRRSRAAVDASFPELTGRELEVLELVAAGRTNQEIADQLFVSPKTARNHVSAVLSKLGVSSRAEAVARARDAGLGPRQS
jgi:DNA-binding NarL/FixJ family response regulator